MRLSRSQRLALAIAGAVGAIPTCGAAISVGQRYQDQWPAAVMELVGVAMIVIFPYAVAYLLVDAGRDEETYRALTRARQRYHPSMPPGPVQGPVDTSAFAITELVAANRREAAPILPDPERDARTDRIAAELAERVAHDAAAAAAPPATRPIADDAPRAALPAARVVSSHRRRV